MAGTVFIVLGNQLFPTAELPLESDTVVFMAEDVGLCTYERHHQQKLVLILAAMRSYCDQLRAADVEVRYHQLSEEGSYEDKLLALCLETDCHELVHYEVEGKAMEARLARFADQHGLSQRVLPSPMFLCTRDDFAAYLEKAGRPHMARFYQTQRHKLDILIDADGQPAGGKWSFDADNRKRLPAKVQPPPLASVALTDHVITVQAEVAERFPQHPGRAADFWLPATREQAQDWLAQFLKDRFRDFGPYEDAITQRSATLFHSALSPALNVGLITPAEVVDAALAHAESHDIPLNSVEGFVRQLIGWREFIRGIYQNFSEQQQVENYWNHERTLTEHWYEGTTGIPPLDDAIKTALKLGWTHHINRLMVVGNLMTLCEIQPRLAHRWFMEMFVDAANWVMGPNVYGMALFSDGGIFATKPYICGSNYLLKMSDYGKGEWCDTVDGLYWRFIAKHLDFFKGNPRLAVIVGNLNRMADERRQRIFQAADEFLATRTRRQEDA